jgi:RND superfamily putative drug exporter
LGLIVTFAFEAIFAALSAMSRFRGRGALSARTAADFAILAFVAFALQPSTEAKIFATALGGGILIDATIIRGVLAPAAVALFGRWNWWLPDWAARLLRVEPSPLEPEAPTQRVPQVG